MSTAPTQPDASPYVSPGDSNQSSGAIVPIAGHTDFNGETEARDTTAYSVSKILSRPNSAHSPLTILSPPLFLLFPC